MNFEKMGSHSTVIEKSFWEFERDLVLTSECFQLDSDISGVSNRLFCGYLIKCNQASHPSEPTTQYYYLAEIKEGREQVKSVPVWRKFKLHILVWSSGQGNGGSERYTLMVDFLR